MVLLRHDTLDRGHHFDWMLSRPAGGETRLVSFRCKCRVDLHPSGEIEFERVGDHRREFLEFEGELTGGRGRVTQVAKGVCLIREESPDSVDLDADWGRGVNRWSIQRSPATDLWVARRHAPAP